MVVFRESRLRRTRRQLATLPRAVRAGRARVKSREPARRVDGPALRDLVAEVAADVELVEVPVDRPPWTATPISAGAGDQITWLAWGRVELPLGTGVAPSMGLLCRVRGGALQESGRDTMTYTADRSGPVEVAGRLPGWVLDDGSITVDRVPYRLPYRAIRGKLMAVIVRWPPGSDPAAALSAVAPKDPSGLCAAEAARLADVPRPPPGWHHHPSTAREEIWSPADHGISLDCRDSAGILRHPADIALTPTLRLRWSWRVDELPSRLPEDTKLTHDYLSIALEFDDGRDLTWHWSTALPEGFAYPCPFDHWRKLETHIVVRSGAEDLGSWIDEERPVLDDHRAAIGGDAPARVVHAWLIGVTFVQGGTARAVFRDIELSTASTSSASADSVPGRRHDCGSSHPSDR